MYSFVVVIFSLSFTTFSLSLPLYLSSSLFFLQIGCFASDFFVLCCVFFVRCCFCCCSRFLYHLVFLSLVIDSSCKCSCAMVCALRARSRSLQFRTKAMKNEQKRSKMLGMNGVDGRKKANENKCFITRIM